VGTPNALQRRRLTQGAHTVPRPFRILSLSGGGVRGIFQATFLRELEQQIGSRARDGFDLIAGTSTGAIVALAVALDVPLASVVSFYREKSPSIFKRRRLAKFFRGPQYSQAPLRKSLLEVFGTKQLKDSAEKHVIVTAATVDRFEHRVFSDIAELSVVDRSLSAVDVALASSAAPTYFSPVKPTSQERTYVDGGVWANSPSLLALLVAHHYLGIPFSDIRLLSVGTGYFPEGRTSSVDVLRKTHHEIRFKA
jgi:uncharacterized protein